MNTLRIIKSIPKFDEVNFNGSTRLCNDILKICWHLLNKITSELERPIPRSGSREGMEIAIDDNDYNPSKVRAHDSGNLDEETHNDDDIKAWDSAKKHLFSVSRLTTTGVARSLLLQFEPKNGQPAWEKDLACFRNQLTETLLASVGELFVVLR